jgi:hypothetical protein
LLRYEQSYVPADEWKFSDTERSRQSALEVVRFEEMTDRVVQEASLAFEPQPELANNRAAPDGTLRATFSILVPAALGDLLHNGRDGLRARYWLSPDEGDGATRLLLMRLERMVVSSLPSKLELNGLLLQRDEIIAALQRSSSKVWVNEGQLRSDGQILDVPRWAANEGKAGNPHMWRWTPQATLFDIKSAWITALGTEWVPDNKRERSGQIHRWGFS